VLMNCEGEDCGLSESGDIELSLADRWIVSRLQETEANVARYIADYRFDLVSQALYEFIWNEYCDWYLELSKPMLWDENASPEAKRGTRQTLIQVLETCMRLLHPLMPFITEEIWQTVAPIAGKSGPTIMLQPYPVCDERLIDNIANADITWLKNVIMGIRNIRGEMNIPPSKELTAYLKGGESEDRDRLEQNQTFLRKLAKLSEIAWLEDGVQPPISATTLVGKLEILVPMADLIDKETELARLAKEIDKLAADIARIEGKLSNASFVAKAPAAVVDKENSKVQDKQQALIKLQEQVVRIKTM
jgi:valyl-tRNA synthetase